MDSFEKDSFRSLLEAQKQVRAEKRGSVFVTLLIMMIFALGGVFYLKTAKPQFFQSTVNCIKSVAATVTEKAKEQMQSGEKPTGEIEGEMLRSAENIEFSYLSSALKEKFENNDFYCFPLKNATVTSLFGARTDPVTGEKNAGHHGIDLAGQKGSSISAFANGTVKNTGKDGVYGNFVTLSHGGFDSFYGHLSEISVKEGDSVRAGESIGIIGSTGKSTGVHLHFEIRKDEKRVDPAPYLYEKI